MNEKQKTGDSRVGSSAVLDDTARMNWLAEHGRIARFSDGWNVWDATDSLACYAIHKDIREAIDLAMRLSSNFELVDKLSTNTNEGK